MSRGVRIIPPDSVRYSTAEEEAEWRKRIYEYMRRIAQEMRRTATSGDEPSLGMNEAAAMLEMIATRYRSSQPSDLSKALEIDRRILEVLARLIYVVRGEASSPINQLLRELRGLVDSRRSQSQPPA